MWKEIRDLADYIGSTGEMINYATNCPAKNYLVCTEEGIHYELSKEILIKTSISWYKHPMS